MFNIICGVVGHLIKRLTTSESLQALVLACKFLHCSLFRGTYLKMPLPRGPYLSSYTISSGNSSRVYFPEEIIYHSAKDTLICNVARRLLIFLKILSEGCQRLRPFNRSTEYLLELLSEVTG